jgi:hypothetical protein
MCPHADTFPDTFPTQVDFLTRASGKVINLGRVARTLTRLVVLDNQSG